MLAERPSFHGPRPSAPTPPLVACAVGFDGHRRLACFANWDLAEVRDADGAVVFEVRAAPQFQLGSCWLLGGSLLVGEVGGIINSGLLAWDLATGTLTSQIKMSDFRIAVDLRAGVAALNADMTVETWDLAAGARLTTAAVPAGDWYPEDIDVDGGRGWVAMASQDRVVVCTPDDVIDVRGLETTTYGWPMRIRPRHDEVILSVDGQVCLLDLSSRRVRAVAFARGELEAISDDGRWWIVEGKVASAVVDLGSGEVRAFAGSRPLAFSPCGDTVVCSVDGGTRIEDVAL